MARPKIEDRIAGACIAVRVRMLNRVVTKLYDDALRPLGLKVSQLNILVVAAKLGIARPAQVCEILHLDASTLSRNVVRLLEQGWIATLPDDDGRAVPFELTSEGRAVLRRALPAWEAAQKSATDLLGANVLSALSGIERHLTN